MRQLKMLLGITDTAQDELLQFLLDDTAGLVLGYCRLEAMPRQLEGLVPIIAADRYRAKGYGQETAPSDIKSVSEGSRSVSYENRRPEEDVMASYYKRLNPFKNRRGRVPSELG